MLVVPIRPEYGVVTGGVVTGGVAPPDDPTTVAGGTFTVMV